MKSCYKYCSSLKHSCAALLALILPPLAFLSCIKNDIPYPRITQNILAIAAEGESKSAYIDSIAFEANIYLEETTDIENVKFTEYKISPDGTSDPNLLEGSYNLSHPLYVTLSRFQDYTWEIIAHQEIVRYFAVEGEIGESVIDPVGHRVIVSLPEGTDLTDLTLLKIKLGPEGITALSPDIVPGKINLLHPMRVKVTCHGRTEIWTIYAELTETVVSTTRVDAWSEVIWAYGEGPADAANGFEYRKSSDTEWTRVPDKYVSSNQGAFSCFIPHVTPLTEYAVRTVSDANYGNEIKVTTQSTADIPDGDFEQWHQNSKKMWCPWDENGLRFWDTGNGGAITLGQNLTTPTDYTPNGRGTAAKCLTKFVGIGIIGKLGTGSIFSGDYVRTDGTNGVLAFGRPWNLRPTRLSGYYQYSAVDIDYASSEFNYLKGRPDTCHIYVALTDWTAPFEIRTKPSDRKLFDKNASYVIGYGELVYSGQMGEYKMFTIDIKYRDTSRVPSYMLITCAASKYGDYFTGGSGSTLYVDQLSFQWDLE
ncbi:MAG: PCMD domain-containing protein [Candidatus Amulumruptor caecigallinarius]|nr:PCMD domain-containing protein [Candidatus Amulumruptor caecigallinarius]